MTDFSKTITNTLGFVGTGIPERWNVMDWGDPWGEGELIQSVQKRVSISLGLASDASQSVQKRLSNGMAVAGSIAKDVARSIALGSLAATFEMTSEQMTDAEGYTKLFEGGVTDGENRIYDRWSSDSALTDGASAVADVATTWTRT